MIFMTQSDSRVAVYTGSFDPITLGHLNVIERAARLGDGMFPLFAPNSDAGKASFEKLWEYVDKYGRDRSKFGLEGQLAYGAGPEKWSQHLEAFKEVGGTHVCVRTMNAGLATPQEHIDAIRRYKAEVG